jgi:hypothetical protein
MRESQDARDWLSISGGLVVVMSVAALFWLLFGLS